MAKKKVKKSNFKIEQEELKPITVGHFESRRKSSLGIFLILSLFILIVIFLPQINNYVNAFIESRKEVVSPGYRPNNPIEIPTDEEDKDKTFYTYSSDLTINDEDITLNSFEVDTTNKTLKFTVINRSNNNLGSLNYYLELYNSNHTLLERLKLVTKEDVGAGESKVLVKNLNEEDMALNEFTLTKLNISEYPSKMLTPNTEGMATLVCSNDHEKVTYTFKDNLLKEFSNEVNFKNTDVDYQNIYTQYRDLFNEYNIRQGISATFFESLEGFNIVVKANLAEVERLYIYNADTFSLDTEVKVVAFEAEAQGFTCS